MLTAFSEPEHERDEKLSIQLVPQSPLSALPQPVKRKPYNSPVLSSGLVWPRISLVTPVYNGIRYIEDTIRSIVNQGYPNLEYIVVDGGSTDGTVDIIRKYQKHIHWWTSQRDHGVYDALNKGFAQTTGSIMGWLNASDLLHTSGLFVVGSVFGSLPDIEWITGRPTRFNPDGMTVDVRDLPAWSRFRFSGRRQPLHSAGVYFLAAQFFGKRPGCSPRRHLPRRRRFRTVGPFLPPRATAHRRRAHRRLPFSR